MSVDENKSLLLSLEKSDVTLVIGDIELPAHRSILSEGSEYFKTMFSSSFIEANSDKVILKETDLKAFVSVLEYIYSGELEQLHKIILATDEFVGVIACARFYMVDELQEEMISHIEKTCVSDACTFLSKAIDYALDDLILYSTDLIRKGDYCFWERTFDEMSLEAVEHLLKLRLDSTESTIFVALVYWMRENPKYTSVFPKLLEHVEVYLVEETQLDMLFEPTELIDRDFCQNLINLQREEAQKVKKVVNQNVINGTDDLRIVDGFKRIYDSGDIFLFSRTNNNTIIDLKQQYLINCIKMTVNKDTLYTIAVSKDTRDWKLVIDHSKYKCSGQQILYFKEHAFRFIRIQNHSSIKIIEILYSTDVIEIDPETTLIVPDQNVVSTKLFQNRYYYRTESGCIDGKICYERVEHMLKSNKNGTVVQLNQPYMIGSVKLLLNFTSSYYIAISTDKRRWTRVLEEENVSGWRIATFEKQPVVFVKIFGTKAPFKCFKLYKLECPAI